MSQQPVQYASNKRIFWMAVGLGFLGVVLVATLVAVWPAVTAAVDANRKTPPPDVPVLFGLFDLSLDREQVLLTLVVVSSAIGSFVHAATSFTRYVGNRRFQVSWTWWYLLRMFIGVGLALIVYFALRGGFFDADATSGQVNPFGIALFSAITGLFSKQATEKLRELFDDLFRVSQGGDEELEGSLASPSPVIVALEPSSVAPGTAAATITVRGTGFTEESKVRIDGEERDTEFQNAQEIRVVLLASDLAESGALSITVANPAPGGGTSPPAGLKVE